MGCYPDGVSDADISKLDPWAGRYCYECYLCREVEGAGIRACLSDPLCPVMVKVDQRACEWFEE